MRSRTPVARTRTRLLTPRTNRRSTPSRSPRKWTLSAGRAMQIDKMLKGMFFDLWQDELELLQSPVTSDGCWPEALLACSPAPPSVGSSTPSIVDSSDDEETWASGDEEEASPTGSTCVTPAMIA